LNNNESLDLFKLSNKRLDPQSEVFSKSSIISIELHLDRFISDTNDKHELISLKRFYYPFYDMINYSKLAPLEPHPGEEHKCVIQGCDASFQKKIQLKAHVRKVHQKKGSHKVYNGKPLSLSLSFWLTTHSQMTHTRSI
jgi:hypothetical protein